MNKIYTKLSSSNNEKDRKDYTRQDKKSPYERDQDERDKDERQ